MFFRNKIMDYVEHNVSKGLVKSVNSMVEELAAA